MNINDETFSFDSHKHENEISRIKNQLSFPCRRNYVSWKFVLTNGLHKFILILLSYLQVAKLALKI